MLRRFARSGCWRGVFALLAACLVLAKGETTRAQRVPLERFNVSRFTPAPGPNNYLQVEGAQVQGHVVPSGGLTLDYAHDAFEVRTVTCTDASETNCEVRGTDVELVSYVAQANLWGAIAIFDRLQIGLNLPLMLSGGDDFNRLVTLDDGTTEMVSVLGGTRFVLADPVLSLKGRLYGGGEGITLAASLFMSFPVGHAIDDDAFLGDESVRFGGQFIAQFIHEGFHLTANVGGFYRPERELFSTRAGSQFTYRAAVGYEVTPLILVYGELDAAAGLSSEVDEHPVEVRAGARYRHGDFTVGGAIGAGVVAGVGVPAFRAIGSFSYAPLRGDSDGDGIEDGSDACPSEPEDVDGWEDEDGCPEADNDGDGMLDGSDPCPTEAEDLDGYQDEDGCPDEDNDEDGVRDGFDSCPDQPEDMDGDRDEDGCPDNDTDRDGIDDAEDRCPNEAEDADGFGDDDGCPENDFDEDGVPDDMDECPDSAETRNGVSDEDGCPEADADADLVVDEVDRCPEQSETYNGTEDDDGCPDGTALIRMTESGVTLIRQVHFRPSRAVIRARSSTVLDAIATVLRLNPAYHHMRVVAYVSPDDDEELSAQRAAAVVRALAERGVEADRLVARGAGSGSPSEGGEHERIEIVVDGERPPTPTGRAATGQASGE